MRWTTLFLLGSVLYVPLLIGSEFAGTWQRDNSKSVLSPPPSVTIQKNGNAWNVKWSTGPTYDIVADGQEHAVPAGQNIFESATYRRIDAKTIEEDGKRGGKDTGKIVWTVSADGQELHQKTEGTYPNGQSYTNDAFYKRANGPATGDPFSGVWKNDPTRSRIGIPERCTITDVENGIEYKSTLGLTYTARFDGKPYPAGATGNTVSLERIDPRTIRAVFKRKDGTVLRTSTMSVSGRELTQAADVVNPNGTSFKSVTVFEKQ
jgi:hypothetical protein